MAEKDGIQIPFSIEAEGTTVTIEKLAAKILELEDSVNKLGAAGKKAGSDIGQGFEQGLGQKAFETFTSFLESVPRKMEAAVEASAKWAEQLVILSERSGQTVKNLEEMSFAAKTNGLEINQLTRLQGLLTPKLISNEKAFTALGLSAHDLSQQDPSAVFNKVIASLKEIQDPAERAAKSIALFGPRFAPQLQPFIAGLDAATKRANELGLVVDEKLVRSIKDFSDELETNREVQAGIQKSFGSFITGDKDVQEALRSTTGLLGQVNVTVQDLAGSFHELPANVKVATSALVLFGGEIAGAAPKIFSFLIGLKQLTGAASIAAAFSQATTSIVAFGAALLPVVGVLASFGAGFAFGKFLRDNIPLVQEIGDGLGLLAQKAGQFLHILPSDADNKKAEKGIVALSGATPEALKALEDFKKKQAEILKNGPTATPAANAGPSLDALKDSKALLAVETQIGGIIAQRSGAIAAANQQAAAAIKSAELELAIKKEEVFRNSELSVDEKARQVGQAEAAAAGAIRLAQLQKEQAIAQENVKRRSDELDRGKAIFDIDQQIAKALEAGAGPMTQIANTQAETVAKAIEERNITVAKLDDQAKLLKLSGDALQLNRAQVAQADALLAKQGALAKAVADQAAAQARLVELQKESAHQADLNTKAIELQHVGDDQLLGVSKVVSERKKELELLNEQTRAQVEKLRNEIDSNTLDAEGVRLRQDEINRINESADAQRKIIEAQTKQKSELEKIVALVKVMSDEYATAGEKVIALGDTLDAVEGQISGIVSGVKGIGSALQEGGNALQRGLAVGKAGGALGASIGGLIAGPVGAAIGKIGGQLIGGIIGALHKPEFQKAAEDVGKKMGVKISDELAKAIASTESKLKVSRATAELLNISGIISESGKDARTFATQITDLMNGIAKGSIPAKEGTEELGKAFTEVADAAEKAGTIGDKALVGILKQARALKLESPEMKKFVDDQLASATEGVHKFVDAIGSLSDDGIKKLGADSGVVFGAMFDALVSEKGIVAAVDALKDDFGKLKDTLGKTLGPEAVDQILGPFGAAFDTLGNEKLRPIFDGIDGLTQAMKGLANAGFLTTDQFTAMQHATKTLFDEAIAGGADMHTALVAVAPDIQAAIDAANQFGVPIDADTQHLKDLAEQNGITFKTDPQQAMLDVLVSIAQVLGADIPESAKRAQKSIEDLAASAPKDVNVGGGGATGGTGGRKTVNAAVTVNLGINENPLAAADTAAAMREFTIQTTADAINARVPAIVAALENG